MNQKEFKKLIGSIGFIEVYYDIYEYKEFRIDLYYDYYFYFNGSEWFRYVSYNDLVPDLLKLSRSIKLKQLLR